MPSYVCELRSLAQKAFPEAADENVRNQIVLTTFIEGLLNPTLRWETRKSKPADVNAALITAVEMQSFLDLEHPLTDKTPKPVNAVSQSDTFPTDTLPTELLQNTQATRST